MEIILFNMSSYNEWQKGVANRNYHIFNCLLNDERVKRILSVDFLPFSFKRAVRNYLENILFGIKNKEVIYNDLTTKCFKINEKLFVFSTIDSFFFPSKVIEKINLVLNKIFKESFYPRIIWSYFPMFVDYFGKLKENLTVFDTVDNWILHPSYAKFKEKLKENYKIIAEKSDIIFTVANTLIDFYKDLGREKDVYFIPNGVNVEFFKEPTEIPKEFKNIPRPIIGFVGIIQQRVDIDLIEYLASKNRDKSFVLIGPIWPQFLKRLRKPTIDIKKLKKYKNIYLLGRKPYQKIGNYIHQFDVAIIPYKLTEFIKFTSPLKLYEYLATGKPVVTTPIPQTEQFSHLIYLAKDYREFNEKIQKALNENKKEMAQLRIKIAEENSWKKRYEEMINLIISKV
jgi:glycosyltransferase involved in cell wall biosynthesis